MYVEMHTGTCETAPCLQVKWLEYINQTILNVSLFRIFPIFYTV